MKEHRSEDVHWDNCSVCGKVTPYACSDCRIDTGKSVHVCGRAACREKHSEVCTGKEQEA
jgi:hypothetical protein